MNGGQCESGRNYILLFASFVTSFCPPPSSSSSRLSSVTQSIYPLIFFCIDLHQSSFFLLLPPFSLTHSLTALSPILHLFHLHPFSPSNLFSTHFVFVTLSLFAVAIHQSIKNYKNCAQAVLCTYFQPHAASTS